MGFKHKPASTHGVAGAAVADCLEIVAQEMIQFTSRVPGFVSRITACDGRQQKARVCCRHLNLAKDNTSSRGREEAVELCPKII